nr:MAG: RNA-dependent RNA polymerase [Jingmen rodent permutotetravirus 2]
MSNPIISKDRFTINELISRHGVAMKQDLMGLRRLAEGAPRTFLSSLQDPDHEAAKLLLGRGVKSLDVKDQSVDLSCLNVYKESCPISTLQYENAQIHPEATNQKDGKVNVKRNFGRVGAQDALLSSAALAHYPLETLEELRDATVYTSGTPKGFSNRIKELTTRTCKSEGKPAWIAKSLSKLLPTTELPDWHDVEGLMDSIKLTASAGAGPPYWVSNQKALPAILDVTLPLVMRHIEEGTLAVLAKEQPELFISELKNKTDRYAMDAVNEKTRPYVNQGTHFSFLFSCLMQPFCSALKTWDEDVTTMNAYGWSMARGGINRVHAKVKTMQNLAIRKRTTKFMIGLYGDDAKLFMATKDGRVYAVDPDFKQMDGSVDFDTVVGVTKWMSNSYTEQHGASPFWDRVLELLAIMATHPPIIVHGHTIYKKKSKDGLLSGAVGTTLFDTAKSALAYNDLISHLETNPAYFTDEAWVTKFMKDKHGLVVKKGTWNPEDITERMEPVHGELWTTNKFLGMRFMWRQYKVCGEEKYTLVPTLNENEWLDLILHPRDEINTDGSVMSSVAKQRKSLDRARGYLVTGAIFNPAISQVLFKAIDMVPAAAVLMAVANGNGKGEAPAEYQIVGEDFEYPNSEGIPNEEWVTRLYSDDTPNPAHWVSVFPTLHEKLVLARKPWRERLRNLVELASIPADPLTKVAVASYVPVDEPVLPTVSTSFAAKERITDVPPLGKTSGAPQSRKAYIFAKIERDGFGDMLRPQRSSEKIRDASTLPTVQQQHWVVIDETESDIFRIMVNVNFEALGKYVMPLTPSQPDLNWLNFIDPQNKGVVKFKTQTIRYDKFEDTETPVAYKRVSALMTYPDSVVELAHAETYREVSLVRKAITFKIYATMKDLVEAERISTRDVFKQKEKKGVMYSVPVAYTREDEEEATPDRAGWLMSTEVTENLEHQDQIRDEHKDPFELGLLSRRQELVRLLEEIDKYISMQEKNRSHNERNEKSKEQNQGTAATTAPQTTKAKSSKHHSWSPRSGKGNTPSSKSGRQRDHRSLH